MISSYHTNTLAGSEIKKIGTAVVLSGLFESKREKKQR